MMNRSNVRIILWNTKGLTTSISTKLRNILSFARANCDLLLLTETHVTQARYNDIVAPFLQPYSYIQQQEWAFAPESDNWSGTAILNFNPNLNFSTIPASRPLLKSLQGRFQLVSINHKKTPHHLTNLALVYAPPDQVKRVPWLESSLPGFLPADLHILAGDFNCILHRFDVEPEPPSSSATFAGSNKLQDILDEHSLLDAYLIVGENPMHNPQRFTFRDLSSAKTSRLDRFYYAPTHLSPNACNVLAPPSDDSGTPGNCKFDHFPIILTCKISDISPEPVASKCGPGPFRAANHWFQNEVLADFLKRTLTTGPFSAPSPWTGEAMVLQIERACKSYKKHFEPIPPYKIKYQEYVTALKSTNLSPEEVHAYKLDWVTSLQHHAEQEREQFRIDYDRSNDQVCKAMSHRLQSRRAERMIHAIRNKQGIIVQDQAGIMRTFVDFYTDLYQTKPFCPDSLRRLLSTWKPSPAETSAWSSFADPFTQKELDAALKTCNEGKSPGDTGLTYAPFKSLSSITSPHLLALYNGIWTSSHPIPTHWKRTMITTIHKGQGAPLDDINARRPISLLNSDYKIFAKMVAKRLSIIATKLTLRNQSGFVPGRNIQDNIIAVLEAINNALEHDWENDQSGDDLAPLIALLDFNKAFDRVNHESLNEILTHLNCPLAQRRVLVSLCSEMEGRINVNGFLSQPIPLRSGVRQGCPIAPILFILVIETLNRAILSDPACKGINYIRDPAANTRTTTIHTWNHHRQNKAAAAIVETEYRSTLQADDLSIGAQNKQSLRAQLNWVDTFCKATSASLNLGKSEILDLHGRFQQEEEILNIPVSRKDPTNPNFSTRYLGAWLNHTGIARHSHLKVAEVINCLLERSAKAPSLTLNGKVSSTNTFLLSKLWYISLFDPPSPTEISKLETSIQEYVWNSSVPRMSWRRMIAPHSLGGLQLIDIESKIQASQISLFLRYRKQDPPPFWHAAWDSRLRDKDAANGPKLQARAKPSSILAATLKATKKFLEKKSNQENTQQKSTSQIYCSLRDAKTGALLGLLTPTMREMMENPSSAIEWDKLFKKLWALPVRPHQRENFWRTVTKTQSRDYSKSRPKCPRCQAPNSTEHMIIDCPDSQFIWKLAGFWFKAIFPHLSQPDFTSHPTIWNLGNTNIQATLIIATFSFIWKRFNAFLHGDPDKAPLQLFPHYIMKEMQTTTANAYWKLSTAAKSNPETLQTFISTWQVGKLCFFRPDRTLSFKVPFEMRSLSQ